MSNYNELSLYLVDQGDVTAADENAEWDGENSILVAATSEEAALVVAAAYERGETQADNLAWNGETIAVITMRDAEGDYV